MNKERFNQELQDLKEYISNKIRIIKRWFKFQWQIFTRGYADSVTWSLDNEISKFILPRLILFKKLNNGFPSGETEKTWDKKLDKMILAFELQQKDDDIYYVDGVWNKRKYNLDQKKITEGFTLFIKHYNDLSW
jgi:hypothetical protein